MGCMANEWWIELLTHPNTATPVSNKKAWNLMKRIHLCIIWSMENPQSTASPDVCYFGVQELFEVQDKHSKIDAKQKPSAAKWVILSKLGPFEPTTLLDLHSTIPSLESRKFAFNTMSEMWRNYSRWILMNITEYWFIFIFWFYSKSPLENERKHHTKPFPRLSFRNLLEILTQDDRRVFALVKECWSFVIISIITMFIPKMLSKGRGNM